MDGRMLVGAVLVAMLTLTPGAVTLAAPQGGPAAGTPCIRVADGQVVHDFTLAETLNFLRTSYTDPGAAGDPLRFAHDLCVRGRLLAYFLSHSAELGRQGFFKTDGAAARQAVAASLDPRFVTPQLAAALGPKDILALHAVVYATSGQAVFDQFMSESLAGGALEGKDYDYLARLKQYILQAGEQIARVRDLSGMYGQPAAIEPACSATSARTCPSGGEKAAGHSCSGACKSGEAKCSGTCSSPEAAGGEHSCSGACKSEGGKCSGTCSSSEGAEHNCSGACKGGEAKCAGKCASGGGCSGSCQGHRPSTGAALSPAKVVSGLSLR